MLLQDIQVPNSGRLWICNAIYLLYTCIRKNTYIHMQRVKDIKYHQTNYCVSLRPVVGLILVI